MHCLQLTEIPTALPLGMFTNPNSMHEVVDSMNAMWSGGVNRVIFGSGAFADRHRAFEELVAGREREAIAIAGKAIQAVVTPELIQEITCKRDLENIPACMHIPLLTMPRLRNLFEEGKIYGWGVDYFDLPEEDILGRLIKNGSFDTTDDAWMANKEKGVEFETRTGDPDYTQQELDAIETSRKFIDTWLEEQLGPGGECIDPTDLEGRIGSLRTEFED